MMKIHPLLQSVVKRLIPLNRHQFLIKDTSLCLNHNFKLIILLKKENFTYISLVFLYVRQLPFTPNVYCVWKIIHSLAVHKVEKLLFLLLLYSRFVILFDYMVEMYLAKVAFMNSLRLLLD